jgi:hypothetical protein
MIGPAGPLCAFVNLGLRHPSSLGSLLWQRHCRCLVGLSVCAPDNYRTRATVTREDFGTLGRRPSNRWQCAFPDQRSGTYDDQRRAPVTSNAQLAARRQFSDRGEGRRPPILVDRSGLRNNSPKHQRGQLDALQHKEPETPMARHLKAIIKASKPLHLITKALSVVSLHLMPAFMAGNEVHCMALRGHRQPGTMQRYLSVKYSSSACRRPDAVLAKQEARDGRSLSNPSSCAGTPRCCVCLSSCSSGEAPSRWRNTCRCDPSPPQSTVFFCCFFGVCGVFLCTPASLLGWGRKRRQLRICFPSCRLSLCQFVCVCHRCVSSGPPSPCLPASQHDRWWHRRRS